MNSLTLGYPSILIKVLCRSASIAAALICPYLFKILATYSYVGASFMQ
jgi:hypothetical protein